jgi:hypothetical protein
VLEYLGCVVVNQIDQFQIHLCSFLHQICQLLEVIPVEAASKAFETISHMTFFENIIEEPLEVEIAR